jgi:hypothetical protein
MKRPQITPGPFALKAGRNIETPSGTFYLTYSRDKGTSRPLFLSPVELDAIAKAIAALPALLEALEDFVRLAQNSPFGSTIEVHESYFKEALEALRLAGYEF